MRPNPDEGGKRTNEIGTIIPVLETLSRWPRVMAPRGIESARNGGDQPALALSRRWRPGERAGADTQAPRETEHHALESGGVDVILVAT